ncbi:hypothetical protein O6H91_02G044400 [Diphasiastrum complanatum]|uniref:Uncharacterized protein n=5 Tax=Diphasiastrum complanatum TaxID=34168 RepID=A0ACC2EF58_DIPCM|nr:hypothetical protein O6H91_02G028000 [Diphasiastrum complanatum]KAJ7565013.1 hypothetical protein O6H91_02G044400 [Diphasiastrum complanatum]KAJ7565014.1 hypothetical protein O6H91_02G044400 [Diphasiastrum complanatum]KAJ7565015.1 hypothetical protein O6H91_02G044400 [Diphasiastrum complanatum]KAJ7565016.1 hypothetical protein O6H91_02G044400 [Diphasiastrum complanatum]
MEYVTDDSKKRKLNDESNGTDVPYSKEDLKKLLEPLSKDQLILLLTDAGSQYPAVAGEIRDVASKDPAHRKLFVRGLSWETTSQALCEAFEEYGEIEEGAVIVDKATGRSKGFGFITFKHMDSAQEALKEPSKHIDGRIAVCNLAAAGSSTINNPSDQSQRKLYIGGLSYETTSDTLLNMFSQYGEIEEGAVAYDKNTNKSRGFAFVTFKTVEASKKALEDPNRTIDGRHVTVKLATEGQKEKTLPAMQVHAGYNNANANVASYGRPHVSAHAAPALGFSTYPTGIAAYAAQPHYPGLGSHYGAVAPYGVTFQTPQAKQPGYPS